MCLRPDRARVVETLVIDMQCALPHLTLLGQAWQLAGQPQLPCCCGCALRVLAPAPLGRRAVIQALDPSDAQLLRSVPLQYFMDDGTPAGAVKPTIGGVRPKPGPLGGPTACCLPKRGGKGLGLNHRHPWQALRRCRRCRCSTCPPWGQARG